jgi:threonine synthase
MIVDVTSIAQDYPSMTWLQPHIKNIWRFGPLMPFDISTDPDSVCTLGEWHTPIIDISNYPICNELNLQIYLKDEGQHYAGYGANSTGSFKDHVS